jgi:hypothetical protein
MRKPMTIAVGGPVVILLVHFMFGGGRLSGRAELRCKCGAMGDQTISAKIRVTEVFIFTMIE